MCFVIFILVVKMIGFSCWMIKVFEVVGIFFFIVFIVKFLRILDVLFIVYMINVIVVWVVVLVMGFLFGWFVGCVNFVLYFVRKVEDIFEEIVWIKLVVFIGKILFCCL